MSVLVLAVGAMIVFSLFVQMSEGATYGIVPFINRKALGAVAGIVGAGGNAGAVAAGFLFRAESITTAARLVVSRCDGYNRLVCYSVSEILTRSPSRREASIRCRTRRKQRLKAEAGGFVLILTLIGFVWVDTRDCTHELRLVAQTVSLCKVVRKLTV